MCLKILQSLTKNNHQNAEYLKISKLISEDLQFPWGFESFLISSKLSPSREGWGVAKTTEDKGEVDEEINKKI